MREISVRENWLSLFGFFVWLCPVLEIAACLQTRQVMAHPQHADQDHWKLSGRSWKLDIGAGHHRLHLCCGWHAAVWQELQGVCVQDCHRLWVATLAHERLLPLFPDCFSHLMWGVDWDHVGLYGGGRSRDVSDGLHDGNGHWKPGGEYRNALIPSLQLLALHK